MTDWYTYEWIWKEQDAQFRVDMQYWNLLPVLSYTQLIQIYVRPRRKGVSKFRAPDSYFFSLLRRKLVDQLSGDAIFVGSVSTDKVRCLFFYTSAPSMIQKASELCREFRRLSVTCTHNWEDDYSTYYRFLYPDDAKLQSVENYQFLSSLHLKSDEKEIVKRVCLHASFLSEEDQKQFELIAPDFGLTVGEHAPSSDVSHPVCCKVYGYAPMNLNGLNALTKRLIDAVSPFDGILSSLQIEN